MNIELVKQLRNRTNVSMSACKDALTESGGDVEAAIELLKKRGMVKAVDKAGRLASQGKLHVYLHGGGSKAALVEVNCETDFAAKSQEFVDFCELVGMQIVGMSPQYVSREHIPNEVVAQQSAVLFSQTPENKPAEFRAKISAGKLQKWMDEVCLLHQECAAVPGKTIEQLRTELVGKIGENVSIRRFVRWEVGEGLGFKTDNFAIEVEKLVGGQTMVDKAYEPDVRKG